MHSPASMSDQHLVIEKMSGYLVNGYLTLICCLYTLEGF